MSKRHSKSNPRPAEVESALRSRYNDDRWLDALRVLAPTGVADVKQIQQTAKLSRDQTNRLLACYEKLAPELLLIRVPFSISRPGVRGRPPVLYRLGEMGAAILRRNGHRQVHACHLKDATALAHAQVTLDVRLAAVGADLDVQTEQELAYGDGKVLRPDNLITLSTGQHVLFEVEQKAGLPLLRRIVNSTKHKAAFFRSKAGKQVSPTVRVLINLPRGREWESTVQVWERATAVVADENDGRLPFQLFAIPLMEFLDRPDWSEPPEKERWESLFDPAQTSSFAKCHDLSAKGRSPATTTNPVTQIPQELRSSSARDDWLILSAFWQSFKEQACSLGMDRIHPDPVFFDVMRIIYVASNDPNGDPTMQVALPHASLYLLRQYLAMHPRLRDALIKTVMRGGQSMRWNVSNILHRMQVVIDVFLRYHGWRSGGPLLVYPATTGWGKEAPQTFDIVARIQNAELLMRPGDSVLPGQNDVCQTEEALAWVIQALFAYSEDLELRRPAFW